MQTPEQIAREKIDRLLDGAGWVLQDRDSFNRNADQGVAVREFPMRVWMSSGAGSETVAKCIHHNIGR